MKKRAITALLVTALFTTVLAACGTDTGGTTTGGGDGTETEDGLFNETGLPIVNESYTFSIFVDDSSSDGEFYMLDELEEQTGITIDLQYYPYETATERLNLDLNTGNYADVIGGWTLNDSMILRHGVQQGQFIPLQDLFAEWAPNTEAILNLPDVRERMTAPDGNIYTIPYAVNDTTVSYSPYINERWLENVGLDMPTTTEEFEAVLQAFYDEDANDNGDPNDEIPFSSDPNNKNIESLAGWFGLPMNRLGLALVDGEFVFAGVSAQYREFLSWFNGLNAAGLVDVELFTQDSSTWEGKGNSDLYGVSMAYGSSEFSGIAQTTEKGEFTHLPVLNTDDGGTWLRATNGFNVYRTQAVITDNAENPEIIARWYDNVFELENGIGINRGPVGVVVFEEEDGYRAIDTNELDEDLQEAVAWGNLWPQALPKYLPTDFEFIEDNPIYDEKKAMEDAYEPYLTENIIPPFWIDLDSIDRFADINTAIIDYYETQQALFITGELDVNDDGAWNSYVQGLTNLGLEEWVEIRGAESILD